MRPNIRRRTAFTLIELLVVIAIIALLIGILLPALGSARKAGQKAVSQTKLRQIQTATFQYQNDFDNYLPWYNQVAPSWIGFCQWTFGGKYADRIWRPQFSGLFDVPPASRPLNPYIYTDIAFTTDGLGRQPVVNWATGRQDFRYTVANDSLRNDYDLDAFRAPSDRASYSRAWLRQQSEFPYVDADASISTYDDTGTSYQSQLRWWYIERARYPGSGANFMRAFLEGMRRFRIGSDFDPSTFALYGDALVNVVPLAVSENPTRTTWLNDFGEENRGLLAFFDGHVSEVTFEPGAVQTSEYSFYFFGRGESADDVPNGNLP